jgi:hypothetical protein
VRLFFSIPEAQDNVDRPGSRTFYSHRLTHPIFERHTVDKCRVRPTVPWHIAIGSFAFGSPGVAPSHGGVGATLLNENETTDVEPSHLLTPACSLRVLASVLSFRA